MNETDEIIDRMFKKDHFSHWLGIEILSVEPGACHLKMTVREEMLNGFGILHGGVSYAFADSAFAFASNSYGRLSVALNTSMSYPTAAHSGDELHAHAEELSLTNKTGLYLITVTNQKEEKVGVFKGTVYRTSKLILNQ